MSDYVGDRGENIATVLLTRLHGRARPLFRPQFLGGKYPTVDFLVELVDVNEPFVPFFFVQVKATAQGYTKLNQARCRRVDTEGDENLWHTAGVAGGGEIARARCLRAREPS